ncbi:LysR family transcriptional regulator [Roseomonas sp. CECT 9278]|uniref:LysR family transcriptional regulator n=1 Tax=Roseomonas sp. CECT 9278 TaxID=2845823 RepID=UPI001E430D33|nr:LysR family transcriptional regulator [Roseomonas sp. CECT 9278]CAH0130555.1 HTH-type transcriptional regulator PgrR [Roseomonas sp. CECT 9278]
MDRLQSMEIFVTVAETGGFAKAAGRLHLSPPVVTRAVAALEERLGVRLFNRTTRSVVPTEAGLRFLDKARSLLQQLEEAEKDAAGEMALPTGQLTVTASVSFGRAAVAPVVAEYLRANPRVCATLLMLDRQVNLIDEGVDIAVRIGDLPDSSMVARAVGRVRRLLVASPSYLARRGVPSTPADLHLHEAIGFTGLMPNREWRYVQDGRVATLRLAPRFELNDAAAAIAAAEAGEGITIALCYMVAGAIREGRLVPVLLPFSAPAVPVHLVTPQARLVAPKVRAFLDLAAPRLRARLESDLAIRLEAAPA